MTRSFLIRILICLFSLGISLFIYIDKLNDLTVLRLHIPTLAKEVRTLQEENTRLQYEIDRFESPIHLMELLRKPEFSHLKYPLLQDIVLLPEGPL